MTRVPYQRLLVFLALLYLLLPNICFLISSLRPYVSLPLCFLLSIALLRTWKGARFKAYVKLTRYDWLALVIVLGVCFFVLECISFFAHIQQMGDFYVRTPLYLTLVECDWYLYSAKGEYFVYYAAFWLPPALLAKLYPGINPHVFLYMWTLLGLVLSFLLLFLRFKKDVLFLFIVLLLLDKVTSCLSLPGVKWRAAYDGDWACIHAIGQILNGGVQYPYWLAQVMQTFHHAVPLMVVISLLFSKILPLRYLPYMASLLVLQTPLGAIGFLFVMSVPYVSCFRSFMIETKSLSIRSAEYRMHFQKLKTLLFDSSLWCGLLLIFVVGNYYSLSASSSYQSYFEWMSRDNIPPVYFLTWFVGG